jgi:hypothetical protein
LALTSLGWTSEEGTLDPGSIVVGSRGAEPGVIVSSGSGEPLASHRCDVCVSITDVEADQSAIYVLAELDAAGGADAAVLSLDPASGAWSTLTDDLADPSGLALAGGGSLAIADNTPGGVVIEFVHAATGARSRLAAGQSIARAFGLDTRRGEFVVAGLLEEGGRGAVFEIDAFGAVTVLAEAGEERTALASPVDVAGSGDVLYVLDMRSRGVGVQDEGRIFMIDGTGEVSLRSVGVEGVVRVAGSEPFLGIDVSAGLVYVVDLATGSDRGGINAFDPETGTFTSITDESLIDDPTGLAAVPGAADGDVDLRGEGGLSWRLLGFLGLASTLIVAATLLGVRRLAR